MRNKLHTKIVKNCPNYEGKHFFLGFFLHLQHYFCAELRLLLQNPILRKSFQKTQADLLPLETLALTFELWTLVQSLQNQRSPAARETPLLSIGAICLSLIDINQDMGRFLFNIFNKNIFVKPSSNCELRSIPFSPPTSFWPKTFLLKNIRLFELFFHRHHII